MQSNKKIAIVRQVNNGHIDCDVRGVAKMEKQADGYVIKLSLVNLIKRNDGEYFVCVDDDKYPLTDLYGGVFSVKNGFSGGVGVIFKTRERTVPLAYGKFFENAKTVWEMIKSEKDNGEKEEFIQQTANDFSKEEYDDDAISLVDYYTLENGGKGELNGDEHQDNGAQILDERTKDCEQKKEEGGATSTVVNEDGDGKQNVAFPTYYQRVKENLDRIFSQYEKEISLENMVANSKWVKIGKGENSYVVGLISFDEAPRYICYGVVGNYGEKPEQIKNLASFIPKSPFNLKGEGFWVMFQDAISGKSDKL